MQFTKTFLAQQNATNHFENRFGKKKTERGESKNQNIVLRFMALVKGKDCADAQNTRPTPLYAYYLSVKRRRMGTHQNKLQQQTTYTAIAPLAMPSIIRENDSMPIMPSSLAPSRRAEDEEKEAAEAKDDPPPTV